MRSVLHEHWLQLGRRTMFVPLAAAALLGVSTTALAISQQCPVDDYTTYRLFRRLMPGGSRADIEDAVALGFDNFLAQQLDYLLLPDADGDDITGNGNDGVREYFPVTYRSPLAIFSDPQFGSSEAANRKARTQVRDARIWRWLYSEQGFYETMTWEWDRFFNIDIGKRFGWMLFPYWNRNVTREHTFGDFPDLLRASAGLDSKRASMMLQYLDGIRNRCRNGLDVQVGGTDVEFKVNENYARELMELHSLGPGNYTEDDILQLAEILAGYEFDTTLTDADFGMVRYEQNYHCRRMRNFLGASLPADDFLATPLFNEQADLAINEILNLTKTVPINNTFNVTSQFVATRLVEALLIEDPRNIIHWTVWTNAIEDAKDVYENTGGSIEEMLKVILTCEHLQDMDAAPDPSYKYMEPVKYVTSLLHAAEADLDQTKVGNVTKVLDSMGQRPFAYSPPIGYPNTLEAWVTGQKPRWDFSLDLFRPSANSASGYCSIDGVDVDVDALYAQLAPGNTGNFDLITCGNQVNRILAAGYLSQEDEDEIQSYAFYAYFMLMMPLQEVKWRVLSLGAMAPSFSLY